jgi:hypothetical protein
MGVGVQAHRLDGGCGGFFFRLWGLGRNGIFCLGKVGKGEEGEVMNCFGDWVSVYMRCKNFDVELLIGYVLGACVGD